MFYLPPVKLFTLTIIPTFVLRRQRLETIMGLITPYEKCLGPRRAGKDSRNLCVSPLLPQFPPSLSEVYEEEK